MRNALAHGRVHLVLWQTPTDWLEVRQVGLVAESALPKGAETIVLSGLKGLSTEPTPHITRDAPRE